jgi:hypothetical protein
MGWIRDDGCMMMMTVCVTMAFVAWKKVKGIQKETNQKNNREMGRKELNRVIAGYCSAKI